MKPEFGDAQVTTIPLLVDSSDEKQPSYSEGRVSSADRNWVSGSTSFFKTCFNGLNALSGVGILSIPYALSSGGWLSLILFLVIASATFYTALLIEKCMDMDPSIRSYPDIGDRAFGAKGRALVSIAMNTELYMVAIGFLILEGDNLHKLLSDVQLEIGTIVVDGKSCFVILVGLIILPTVWLDNMSILSFVSASGVIASFILLGSILWTGAFDGIGFHEKGSLLNWDGIPTAVSLYAFCYCAHPVFPTLYTSMRNQKQFSKVLALCFLVCTLSYASMAILGYLMFGSEVKSQITLNLPISKISSRLAIYTTLVNPIAKYALMVTPIVNAAENHFLSYPRKRILSLLIRTILVISTIIIAVAIPLFEHLMALVGAFLSVTASVILPCVCFLKISGVYRRFGFELLFVLAILLIGICVLVAGTYTSLGKIIKHLFR